MLTAKLQGFTLPELLTTLSVIIISISLSLPNFYTYIQENVSIADINHIKKLIYQAKSSAISSGTHTTICVIDKSKKCDKSSNWKGSITIFYDSNRNGAIDNSEKIIQKTELGKHAESIKWRAFNNKGYLQFSPLGLSTISNGTFTYCSKASLPMRQLVMNRQGRLRIRKTPHTNAHC